MSGVAAGIVQRGGVIAAVHLDRVTYGRSGPASRYHLRLLTCGFPCCGLAEDASFADCPWRVTEAGATEAIGGILTRERNHVVSACDDAITGHARDFPVRLAAVKIQSWCAE